MKLKKSCLIDSKTQQPVSLPEYEPGEDGYEHQQMVRKAARESTESLLRIYEQSRRDKLKLVREENRKLKHAIENLKCGLEVIAKGEYDFGEDFTGDEAEYTAKRLLDDLKEAGL